MLITKFYKVYVQVIVLSSLQLFHQYHTVPYTCCNDCNLMCNVAVVYGVIYVENMYDDCLLGWDETTLVLYLKVSTVYSTLYPVMLICHIHIHSLILSSLGRYLTCWVNTRNSPQKVLCLMKDYYCQILECNQVLFSTQLCLVLFKWLLNLILHKHFYWQPGIDVKTSILTGGSLNSDFTL